MRVLCSALPLEGHVRPLLPIARALLSAGHEVRIATGADFHQRVHEAGFVPVLAGPTFEEGLVLTERDPRFAGLPVTARGNATFTQIIAPAKLLDLDRIVAEWRPDLVVHECTDFAAPIAAATAGVPAVTQGWGLVTLPEDTVRKREDIAYLWRSRDLEVDPYGGIFGAIHLHPMPASLQPNASVPVGYLQPMHLDMQQVKGAALPGWADRMGAARKPVIYVSLGTHPYFSQLDYFRTILDGFAKVDAEVVATVGAHLDPQSLGPQPDNVHLERWLPLPVLLPRCSLAVCHAGSGTLLATLAAGLPLLLLPRGADQFTNAAASAQAGAARVLAPEALTSDAIADAVEHLLVEDSYRRAGARVRAEIEAMPAPATVVPLLEQLARTLRSPIPSAG